MRTGVHAAQELLLRGHQLDGIFFGDRNPRGLVLPVLPEGDEGEVALYASGMIAPGSVAHDGRVVAFRRGDLVTSARDPGDALSQGRRHPSTASEGEEAVQHH